MRLAFELPQRRFGVIGVDFAGRRAKVTLVDQRADGHVPERASRNPPTILILSNDRRSGLTDRAKKVLLFPHPSQRYPDLCREGVLPLRVRPSRGFPRDGRQVSVQMAVEPA